MTSTYYIYYMRIMIMRDNGRVGTIDHNGLYCNQ